MLGFILFYVLWWGHLGRILNRIDNVIFDPAFKISQEHQQPCFFVNCFQKWLSLPKIAALSPLSFGRHTDHCLSDAWDVQWGKFCLFCCSVAGSGCDVNL
jgi:hypothetical protein